MRSGRTDSSREKAVLSPVMLIGQAPGDKEGPAGRPFAWTAGKTLFGWYRQLGVDEEQFREGLVAAIDQLPERERLVLSLYYEREMNLKEIGEVLDVTESRVCQIHGQAIIRMRSIVSRW